MTFKRSLGQFFPNFEKPIRYLKSAHQTAPGNLWGANIWDKNVKRVILLYLQLVSLLYSPVPKSCFYSFVTFTTWKAIEESWHFSVKTEQIFRPWNFFDIICLLSIILDNFSVFSFPLLLSVSLFSSFLFPFIFLFFCVFPIAKDGPKRWCPEPYRAPWPSCQGLRTQCLVLSSCLFLLVGVTVPMMFCFWKESHAIF